MSLPGSSDRLERSYPSAQSASQASTSAAPKSSAAQLAQRPTTQPVNGVASFPQLSASTEEIVKRINANGGAQPGLQAAREQVLQRIVTSENIATPTRQTMPGRGRGRGRGRARGSTGSGTRSLRERKEGAANAPSTPTSRRGRASSRGRGGSKRGGARKRIKTEEDEEEEFDDDGQTSDVRNGAVDVKPRADTVLKPYTTSSETFTSLPTKTKSGRRVHRPTQYDPAVKTPTRRRGPYRRLAEATICRVCQRGYSPSKNMIVYCDGCNTPYHQYCHDPPIEDDVVKVEEKEWACIECTSLRRNASAKGLSEVELQTAVGGEGLSPEEVCHLVDFNLDSMDRFYQHGPDMIFCGNNRNEPISIVFPIHLLSRSLCTPARSIQVSPCSHQTRNLSSLALPICHSMCYLQPPRTSTTTPPRPPEMILAGEMIIQCRIFPTIRAVPPPRPSARKPLQLCHQQLPLT